jgi:hypothetical protein
MKIERRFIFRGNAAAVSGMIIRPAEEPFVVQGASSLTVSGGRSSGRIGGTEFGKFLRVDSAETSANGEFADADRALRLSHRQLRADEVETTTVVWADVKGLKVGDDPVLGIGHLYARLEGRSPELNAETLIQPADLKIDNVSIGGFRLNVVLDYRMYATHDTKAKLLAAAADPSLDRDHAATFLRADASHDRRNRRPLFTTDDMIYSTVVRELNWADNREYPGSEIDGHVLTIPEFGKVYFGEIFITSSSRRLTMARFELGSPVGGSVAVDEVETNGSWYPP